MTSPQLEKLRRLGAVQLGPDEPTTTSDLLQVWAQTGVKFTSSSSQLEHAHQAAVLGLFTCLKTNGLEEPVLQEGGNYPGCWLESTGTVSAETLSRFMPRIAESTLSLFADHQRKDGLMPYKLTADGPAYTQIQLVSPLARSVWNQYRSQGSGKAFLLKMYYAMERYDAWLVAHRNTRATGCVEAFCTFDTGHDLSPRFWHCPDMPHQNDATQCDPDSPVLPFLAPDLTANVVCQRRYLALIAAELGISDAGWQEKAEASLKSLFEHCFDAEDGFFYDRDKNGVLVRVQSDILLRVLACEIGDREFFDAALKRYLLNTRKFFAKYPFPSLAMDDPRHQQAFDSNSWAGPSNFLSLLRAPQAFDHHERHVEFTWVLQPIISALSRNPRFAQTLSPWTGQEGFTEAYSPAILCLLDYVERLCGILPTPQGELWFTGLVPREIDHRQIAHETAYSRVVDGRTFELVNTPQTSTLYRDGAVHLEFPHGIRAVTDLKGNLKAIIGMSVTAIEGTISERGTNIPFTIEGNERLEWSDGKLTQTREGGVIPPSY